MLLSDAPPISSLVILRHITSHAGEANKWSFGKFSLNLETRLPLVPLFEVQLKLDPLAANVREASLCCNVPFPKVHLGLAAG